MHVVVDPHRLDSAHRSPHAVPDLRPFECRAGRRRARHEPLLRAHDHLAVGADVDQGAQLVALVDAGREHARHGVGADEAGNDRQKADLCVRRGLQRKLSRRDDDAVAHRGRVRGEPHEGHVDAEEDVVHAGVADHHDLVDVVAGYAGVRARLPDEAVDRVQHLGAERDELLLVELRIGDARHEVAAVDGLGVDAADRGQLLAGLKMQERPHDAGGADVERHAVGVLGGVSGLDVEDAAVERGDRELAALLAQLPGDLPQRRDWNTAVDRRVDGRQHLSEIGGLAVLLARGARGDDLLLHAGVDREPRAVRGPAVERIRPGRAAAGQDLVSRLRLRRQGHHLAVGDRAGLAGEPKALAHLLVAELEGVLHGGRRDVAGEDLASAAPAAAPGSARGVHGDARRPGGVKQRGAASDTRPAHRLRAVGVDEADLDSVAVRFLHRAPILASRNVSKCSVGLRLRPTALRPRHPPMRSQESAPALTVVGIALRPTPLAAPPRASARASPPAPRRGPSRRRRTRRPIPGWSARRPPGSSPSRGARP